MVRVRAFVALKRRERPESEAKKGDESALRPRHGEFWLAERGCSVSAHSRNATDRVFCGSLTAARRGVRRTSARARPSRASSSRATAGAIAAQARDEQHRVRARWMGRHLHRADLLGRHLPRALPVTTVNAREARPHAHRGLAVRLVRVRTPGTARNAAASVDGPLPRIGDQEGPADRCAFRHFIFLR